MEKPLVILDLKYGDTLETARKKRNALFLKLHPDKNKNDKEEYQKVYDAFLAIEQDPSLLKPKIKTEFIGDSLKVRMKVSIEDFYFQNTKNATVERKVFCKKCCGTKTKTGLDESCSYCNGKGVIKSSILSLIDKNPICPKCQGLGIPQEKICPSCNGSGYEKEYKNISFKLTLYDYHNKMKIINNAGNQLSSDKFGKLIIHLKVIENTKISIEEDYFVMYEKVLPIQKIIGDKRILNVFGRKVPYSFKAYSNEAYALDNISRYLTQEIRVKFIEVKPLISKETAKLYRKILEIEKREIEFSPPVI